MSQCFMIVVCEEELYWWIQKSCDPKQGAQLLVLNPRDCLVFSLVTRVVGHGAPSTSLLVVQNWEEWLVQQRVLLPSRKILTG